MKPTTRDRLALPILLPVGILGVIGLVLWGFSRVLLGVEGDAATTVAIVVAASILGFAAIAATRPQVRGSTVAALAGATAGVAMLAGGIALAVVAGGEGGQPGGGPGPGAVVNLTAQNIAFDPTTLQVPAGKPFTIAFDNRDGGVQHNVEIFDNKDFSGTPLFSGDLITGPTQANYDVDALDEGTYYFRCVVHPQMTGEIDAKPAPPGGGGGGGGPGVTVTAQNLAFDTAEIHLPANAPSTITFDNRDAGTPHNIAIYSDSDLTETLFQGDIVTGPTTVTYQIPPLPAGEYYFHCDVHPNMNGTVIVDGGGSGASGASGASGG